MLLAPFSSFFHPSNLPLFFEFKLDFAETKIVMNPIDVEPSIESKFKTSYVFANDVVSVLTGTRIIVPLNLLRYYPSIGFKHDMKIDISIWLKKTGSLKL